MPLDSSAVNAFANAMAQKNAGQRQDKAALMGGIMDLGQGLIAGQDKLAIKKQKEEKENAAKEKIRGVLAQYQLDPNLIELGPNAAISAIMEAKRQAFEKSQFEDKRKRNVGQSQAIMGALGIENPPEIDDVDTAYNVGNALQKQKQTGEQRAQFGSLMAPTPRMPIGNPLGFPGMPSEIPSMPATPGAVSMRAGTMKGGVDPSVFAKAMEGAQATYPKPKPQAETAWSPEAIERRKMLAEFQAGLSSKSDADRAAAARTLQQERLAAQQKMQEESIAARREIEELRVANDPRLKQMALQALTTRKSGLLPRLTKAMETANYGPDDEAKKAAADEAKTIRDTLAEIDAALKGMSSMQPVPAPQGAPSGGDQPTPDEMKEWTEKGFRWDPTRGGFVR